MTLPRRTLPPTKLDHFYTIFTNDGLPTIAPAVTTRRRERAFGLTISASSSFISKRLEISQKKSRLRVLQYLVHSQNLT